MSNAKVWRLQEKRRARYLCGKVINFLKEGGAGWTIRLDPLNGNRKLHKRYGLGGKNKVGGVSRSKKVIVVDPREDAVSTLIHEVLHVLYWRVHEEDIAEMEVLVREYLTRQQAEKVWIYASRLMATRVDIE